jgi:hypothetical protein
VVTKEVGMRFPEEGLFTKWFLLDFGFTIFLITYAADMMSLFISALSHSPTTAMTIMPFVLVFQLIFSGGIISIPQASEPIAKLTISNPGFKAMAAQADVNSRRYATVTRMLTKMGDTEFEVVVTVGQIVDLLEKNDATVNVDSSEPVSIKEIDDQLASDQSVQAYKETEIPITITLGELMELVGEKEAKAMIDEGARKANYKPEYEHSKENIVQNWLHLMVFILIFPILSIIILEFIDKDKR